MKLTFYALLFLFSTGLYAQAPNNCGIPTPNDFVINGGFEQFSSLPNSTGQVTRACNWLDNANTATPDYFHRFVQDNNLSLPENPRGHQTVSQGGDAYVGVAVQPRVFNGNPVVYTEIIGTQLQSSLQPGAAYDLSFDISRADNMGMNPIKIQAFLGSQFNISSEHELPIQTDPNGILLENGTFSNNTTGWDTVTFTFTAGVGQTHLYLGGISNTEFQNPNAGGFLPTYYYIDNVSLVLHDNTTNTCDDESITITSDIPDCNVFENSNTFDICGTFTTNATSTYNLSLNRTDLNAPPFPQIPSLPITNISNITTTNGITSGEFCITLNASDFNLNNNYQIDVRINSQINGEPCSAISNVIMLPFNDCTTTTCPDCKSDIMENISIVPTANCNTFEFNIPELSDCFEVVYSLNDVDQGQLPEGASTLTLNENGSYSIQIGVIDIETGKACAKRTFKIDVECSDEPCPDCNKDILDNISIEPSKEDCNTFIVSVPKLYDCYKVVYFINGEEQGYLGEGTSTINFEENGSYTIGFAVLDIETGKACAKKEVKIEVDCSNNTVCVENPALEDLLATHLKNILNAILDLNNDYTGQCPAGSVSFVEITNMPEVIQFMQEYNLEVRLQHAMDKKEIETNGNYSGYTVNITKVYYKWGSNSQGHPPCLSIWFTNENITENGSVFLYQIAGGYENGGVPISQTGLNPTSIQEFTDIEIDVEQNKATYNYIGNDGQPYSLYDALQARTISEHVHSGLDFCLFHDLSYNPPPVFNDRISLYPNPVTDKVTVSLENTKIASIEVFNIYGKPIQTITNVNAYTKQIDMSRLAQGYYVVKVTLNDGTVQHKNVVLK